MRSKQVGEDLLLQASICAVPRRLESELLAMGVVFAFNDQLLVRELGPRGSRERGGSITHLCTVMVPKSLRRCQSESHSS